MSKATIALEGKIPVPFTAFVEDPLLLLKKFPLTARVNANGPKQYVVTTTPTVILGPVRQPRRWHINLKIEADKIICLPVANADLASNCDGWIEGEIVADGEARCDSMLKIHTDLHRDETPLNDAERNALDAFGHVLLSMLVTNLKNTGYQNTLPT